MEFRSKCGKMSKTRVIHRPKIIREKHLERFDMQMCSFFSAVISRRLINDDVKYELFMHYNVVLILIFIEIDIDQIMRGGVDVTRIK